MAPTLGSAGAIYIQNVYFWGGDRHMKAAVRCSVVLSVTCLMVLAQPLNNNQTDSNDPRSPQTESSLYSVKLDDKLSKIQYLTAFPNYNSENLSNRQVQIIDKNTNILGQKIGLISSEDYWNLCWLVAAEAENQPIEGKMAVCGVVLNRTEYGPPFEDTITGAIFQENAFSCVSDGRFFKACDYVSEEDQEAVNRELAERYYVDVLYFTAGEYGKYGTPAYVIGDHYFCYE